MKLAALLIVLVCSFTELWAMNLRITGGTAAEAGQYPFMVSVTESDRHICGGFIYANRWIVTAASCVAGKSASTLKAVVNQLNLINFDATEKTLPVFSITLNDKYNATSKYNDIALLKLNADIAISPAILEKCAVVATIDAAAPPCFIEYNEVVPGEAGADGTGQIMGWGATTNGGFESTSLRFGEVAISEATPCGDYTDAEFQLPSMLCVVGTASSPCQYDEGSPLVQTYGTDPDTRLLAVGIMSRRASSCLTPSNSIYTRLSAHYAWLLKTAGPQV